MTRRTMPYNPFDDDDYDDDVVVVDQQHQQLEEEEQTKSKKKKNVKSKLKSFWNKKLVQKMNRTPSSPLQVSLKDQSISSGEEQFKRTRKQQQKQQQQKQQQGLMSPVSRTTEDETEYDGDDLSWEISPITLDDLLIDDGDHSPEEEGFEIQSPISNHSVDIARTTVVDVSQVVSHTLRLPALGQQQQQQQQWSSLSSSIDSNQRLRRRAINRPSRGGGRWAVRAEPAMSEEGEKWIVHNDGDSSSSESEEDSVHSKHENDEANMLPSFMTGPTWSAPKKGDAFDPIDLTNCDYRLFLRKPADAVSFGLVEDAEEAYEELVQNSQNIVTRSTYLLFGVNGTMYWG